MSKAKSYLGRLNNTLERFHSGSKLIQQSAVKTYLIATCRHLLR